MGVIKVDKITRKFRRQIRKKGIWGALQSLFSREYEEIIAVNNVSFEIPEGEILGYIGPNGAGKSTTIKMLVGILVPSSGHIEVNGIVPYKSRIENAKNIGVVFGQRTQLWWDIPVSESFNLLKYMYKIQDKQFKENIEIFSDILSIDEFINVPVRQLSLGQRMRADLCAAMLHNPRILYLDEPTIGLDVVVKEKIRQFIKRINAIRKTTVILTTHDMSDIEKLCHKVMLIHKGEIVYTGDLNSLKNVYGPEEEVVIDFFDNKQPEIKSLFEKDKIDISFNDNRLHIKYDKKVLNSTMIIERILSRHKIKDFVVKDTDIESVIRTIYSKLKEELR